MQPHERKKIQQTIATLQQLLGQKSSGGSSIIKIPIPGLDQQVSNFTNIGKQLQPQIQQLTKILSQSINLMQGILNHSAVCKQPTDPQKQGLQQKFMNLSKQTENIQKNPNFVNHARAVRQLLSAAFWVLTNSPQFIIKGGIQASDFNAIKFMKNKNQGHNDWWKSIQKSFRAIEQFSKKQYPMGLSFNPNGTGSWDDVSSDGKSSNQTQQHAPQQQQPAQTQPQQKVQAPKVPKKQLQGMNWLVANLNNQKVTFNPGQIQMKHGLFIQNCKDCVITIDDKFKSLQMNNSSNIVLVVNSCVSGVQVMNGSDIQVYIKGQSPSLSIDKCQKVRVILNEAHMQCDIVTSKVSQVNITYQKGGNQAKSYMVAEQLITKWNAEKKKFETVIYDKFM